MRSLTALAAALTLAACSTFGPLARGYLDIEPAELQARLAKRFPLENCKLVVACLSLSNPTVALAEGDDRITFTTDVRLTLGTRERTGHLAFNGRPRYAPEEGQLFLDDVQITTLDLPGLAPEIAELVKSRGGAEARHALQSRPIYTLDASTAKGAYARRNVRDVKVVGGRLRVLFTGTDG